MKRIINKVTGSGQSGCFITPAAFWALESLRHRRMIRIKKLLDEINNR